MSSMQGIPAGMLTTTDCKTKVAYYSDDNTAYYGTFTYLLADWSSSLNSSIDSLKNYSASPRLLSTWTGARNRLSDVSVCIEVYKQLLDDLMKWLNSTDQQLSAASTTNTEITPSVVLINAFVKSGNVLKANLSRFLTGTMSKVELANAFSSWNSGLLNSASSLVSDIESSVITKLSTFVDSQQSTLTNIYLSLLPKLSEVQAYLASNDNSIEQLARSLLIWQTPVIGLQSDQVGLICVLRQFYQEFTILVLYKFSRVTTDQWLKHCKLLEC